MNKYSIIAFLFLLTQFLFSQENKGYLVKNININDMYSNFGVTYFSGDKVFFSSPKKTNTGDVDLYFGFIDDYGDIIKKEPVETKINSKSDEMDVAFTKDYKTVYFTRKTNRKHLDLYKADVVAPNQWKNIKRLPFNRPKKSFGYPCLSEDDKTLYFSSNKIGPMGQFDIFKVAILGNNKYGKIKVLGQNINTLEDETTPFIVNDTLYFASKGRGGLGGYDIFKISLKDKNAVAINLGKPFNSAKDDYAFVKKKQADIGYFTSKRANGKGGDDIYSFQKYILKKEDLVLNDFLAKENERIALENEQIAKDNKEIVIKNRNKNATEDERKKNALIAKENEEMVLENQRIAKANKALKDKEISDKSTRKKAREARDLKDRQELAKKNREKYARDQAALRKQEELAKREASALAKAKETKRIEELAKKEAVLAKANEAKRKQEELAKRETSALAKAKETKRIEELAKKEAVLAKANEAKRKQEELAKREASALAKAKETKRIEELAKKEAVLAKANEAKRKQEELAKREVSELAKAKEIKRIEELANKEAALAKKNLLDEKNENTVVLNDALFEFEKIAKLILVSELEKPKTLRKLNLKEKKCKNLVEKLEDIYFDLDKFSIRFDAAIQLNIAIAVMKRCPNATFIASSHTDSRGKSEYNRILSQKRATAVVDYILKYSNLDISRFKGIGYGESQLKNRCADGVTCSNEEHQVNRRNELDIIFN